MTSSAARGGIAAGLGLGSASARQAPSRGQVSPERTKLASPCPATRGPDSPCHPGREGRIVYGRTAQPTLQHSASGGRTLAAGRASLLG